MKHDNQSICLTVPASANYVDIIRLALYGISTKWGFSYEEIEDMKVAVAEACNNAVLHAYQTGEIGVIDVTFNRADNGISISVKDQGSSFDYNRRSGQTVGLHDKDLSEIYAGGLGIYLMQALMDDVQVVTNSGTEVILTKFLQTSEGTQ